MVAGFEPSKAGLVAVVGATAVGGALKAAGGACPQATIARVSKRPQANGRTS